MQPTNGLATASLVLGILSLVLFFTFVIAWILAILAIVFGAIAVGRANLGAPNKSTAVAGLVLGIAGIGAGILFVLIIVQASTQIEHQVNDRFSSVQVCIRQTNC